MDGGDTIAPVTAFIYVVIGHLENGHNGEDTDRPQLASSHGVQII